MKIADANAAIRIARWAYDNREILPDRTRRDIAQLAETAGRKMLAGLREDELVILRGDR